MKTENIAQLCHEINRIYCKSLGDNSQKPWHLAPAEIQASAVDGVKFVLDTPNATPELSHQNWLKFKIANGWKYGPIKNETSKEHPCMVPYDKLPEEQKIKDELFYTIVNTCKD